MATLKRFNYAKWGAMTASLLLGMTPLLLIFLVLMVYLAMYNGLVLCDVWAIECEPYLELSALIKSQVPESGTDLSIARLNAFPGRLSWILAAGLCLFLGLLALVAGGATIYRLLDRLPRTKRLGAVFLASLVPAVAAILFTLSHTGNPAHPWRQFIHQGLTEHFAVVTDLTPILDDFGIIVAVFLASTVTIMLVQLRSTATISPALLQTMLSYLRIVLYSGALLLVANVIRISILMNWSLSFLPEEAPILEGLNGVVHAIVISQGSFYTLMLACIYLPAAAILKHTADRIRTNDSVPSVEREKWLNKFSFVETIPKFIAILAPLISGPAAEILGLLP